MNTKKPLKTIKLEMLRTVTGYFYQKVQLRSLKAVFKSFLPLHNRNIGYAMYLIIKGLSRYNRNAYALRFRYADLLRLLQDKTLTISKLMFSMLRLCNDFITPKILIVKHLRQIVLKSFVTFREMWIEKQKAHLNAV